MIRCLSVCFVLFLFGSAGAQGFIRKFLVMQDHDTVVIRKMIELADEKIYNAPDSSGFLFLRALEKTETLLKNKNNEGYLLKAKILNGLAYLHIEKGEDSLALLRLNESLRIFRQLKNREGEGRVLNDFAYLFGLRGENDSAFYYHEKCVDIFMETGNHSLIAFGYYNYAYSYRYMGDFEKAFHYNFKALEYAKEGNNKVVLADIYSNLGVLYRINGNLDSAIACYDRGIEILADQNDLSALTNLIFNRGAAYEISGNYAQAIDSYIYCLRLAEKINDQDLRAACYNNLGFVFYYQQLYQKSVLQHKIALAIRIKIKNSDGVAESLSNIGSVYAAQKEYKKAKKYYERSLAISLANNNPRELGKIYNNFGTLSNEEGNSKEAESNFRESYRYFTMVDEKEGLAKVCRNLSELFFNAGRFSEAEKFAAESEKHALKSGFPETISGTAWINYRVQKQKRNFSEALRYHELYLTMNDSIHNMENKKAILEKKTEYDYEMKKLADSIENKRLNDIRDLEIKSRDLKIEKDRQQKYFLYGSILFLAAVALIIFNRFKVTRRQKNIIQRQKTEVEHQKEIVEEKNREILDSIAYAKRLQDAILPPLRIVKEYLPDSFILYRPKDIVAGDFYFMEPLNEMIVFAAADCTGHGVPGAMVSVVCANAMNRAVKEFKLTDPALILNKVRELVTETFEKSESEVKDGMDISLCVLDTKNKILHWAGANNPLWIIEGKSHEAEGKRLNPNDSNSLLPLALKEYKPDKQPIGKSYESKPFTPHVIKLEKNDCIYIFTDGFEDQFGGEKGKKFKAAKMKELFLSIHNDEMEKQKQIISAAFDTWKGDLEQVDDVCIIGVRL